MRPGFFDGNGTNTTAAPAAVVDSTFNPTIIIIFLVAGVVLPLIYLYWKCCHQKRNGDDNNLQEIMFRTHPPRYLP